MSTKSGGPAWQDGAEGTSTNENNILSNTTQDQSQGKGSNGQLPETELGRIVSDITDAFTKHLSLQTGAAETMALWVVSAHTLDEAEFSPRLVFSSPAPECGKSTALEMISELVPSPMPTSNATPAVIYRSLENGRPTLIIDEADTFLDDSNALLGILNSGHKRAMAFVHRCEASKHGGYFVKEFSTFCPMVIARIGDVSPALQTRSIVIRMQRAKPNEKIARFTSADRIELQKIKQRIEQCLRTGEHKKLKNADPPLPAKNRLADNWRHLIAIADLAGGEWPLMRSAIAKLAPEAEEFSNVAPLAEIRRAFSASPLDKLTSAEVCEYLNNLESGTEAWTAQSLASKLKPFGIRPKAIRIGGKVLRGYELAQFTDVFERYLDKDPTTQDGSVLRQTPGSPATPQQDH